MIRKDSRSPTSRAAASLWHCPTRRLLGVPCPSCGLTRSLAALARGELRESARYHPLGLPLAAGALVAFAAYPLRYTRPVARHAGGLEHRRDMLNRLAIVAIFAVWLVRLSDRTTRARLAPEPGLLRPRR